MANVPKWTAGEIELAVAEHFGFKTNIIVPNVSYGMFRSHEADLVVLKASGWADEIEIKVSRSDIKADARKNYGRGHVRANIIRCLWFALPEHLADEPSLPAFAGILAVSRNSYGSVRINAVRAPEVNKAARKMSTEERLQLSRLACFRVWSLKRHLLRDINAVRYADRLKGVDARWDAARYSNDFHWPT